MSSGFISEAAVEERKKIRQEQWDLNRKEGDPEEAPEEPIPDHRSLYDRLKEQKDKKDEEWEETHKLKNMVRGLEDDEVGFLELVDSTKQMQEQKIKSEETAALEEFRKKVSELNEKAVEIEVQAELKSDRKSCTGNKRTSQVSLLSNAIKKRRSQSSNEEHTEESKPPLESPDKSNVKIATDSGLQCVAVLPGLGVYTDSSDSEESGSDSDLEERSSKPSLTQDITGRIVHVMDSRHGKGCC